MSYRLLLILMLAFGVLWVSPDAYAAQTATVTDTLVQPDTYNRTGWTWQRSGVYTASAANEQACMDVRGYEHCTAKVDVSGTINVDLDWSLTSTYDASFVVSESDDITADTMINPAIDGLYLCYDVDSCTTCTLTLTITCVGQGIPY